MSDALKMPAKEISKNFHLAEHHNLGSRDDFVKVHDVAARQKFGNMTNEEMRKFMEEEQKEGKHPSLKGKKF